jgi:hypothetical protein
VTYGSLGTGIGVSDSDPFTTVRTTGVDAAWERTDVVTVTTGQRYSSWKRSKEVEEDIRRNWRNRQNM